MRLSIQQGTVPIWTKFDSTQMAETDPENVLRVALSMTPVNFGPFSILAFAVPKGVAPLPANLVAAPIEFDPFHHSGGTGSVVLIRVFRRPPPTLPAGVYDVYAMVGSNGGFSIAHCEVAVPAPTEAPAEGLALQGTVPIWSRADSDISSSRPHTDGRVGIFRPKRGVQLACSHAILPMAGGPAPAGAVSVTLASMFADSDEVAFGLDYVGGLDAGTYVVQVSFATMFGSIGTSVRLEV